jgi:non-lysosomal glucosylceramidase
MPFDPESGAYIDTRVARGFPLGGMGSGGIALNTDGSFGELRLNNNWMCPIRGTPGSFHALFVQRDAAAGETILLRLPPGADQPGAPAWREYAGVRHVRSTTFVGTLPTFRLRYDDALPVTVTLEGFTPHVAHDLRASTLPAAVFRFHLENPGDEPLEAALLFSFENVLGRGGTGHLGVELGPDDALRTVRQPRVYDDVAGNHQIAVETPGRRGVRFRSTQRYDPRSHRAGVTGEYLLLVEPGDELEITVCDGWNAAAPRASVLDEFARDGRIQSHPAARDVELRPAAAVAARTRLAPRATRDLVFVLAWWTADHVTEPALATGEATDPSAPGGTWVGHAYATYFADVDAVAAYVLDRRAELEEASTAVNRMLEDSSLPPWLLRALANSRDAILCNSVIPASGRLYTLEGVDWAWPMGGLTGTNDQRLAAHPYLSAFFTDLDLGELDTFRRLAAPSGAIPHGNGNCDLGLGTTDVPYGWPMVIRGFLPAREWTDLTMSQVIQVCTAWRRTGRHDVLERFWPSLTRGMEYLHGLAPEGVPLGGTTFDVWDLPGVFVYSATLYLAALRLMIDAAAQLEPACAAIYQSRFAACTDVLEERLWDDRGFYRTSPDRPTLFTGALAGDWAARYAGADPVVDPARAASHLRHAHRALVLAAIRDAGGRHRPLPRAEAHPDGTPVRPALAASLPPDEEMTYVWQVLPYQAMEQIYLGQIHEALQTMQLIYDRIWHDGLAWSAGLRATGESIYMTHPTLWAVLSAFTGTALDVPARTLVVAPRSAGEIGELRCPFFFPALWGTLDYHPGSGRMDIEIVRTFGAPVTIEHVAHRGASGALRRITIPPTELIEGCRVEVTL